MLAATLRAARRGSPVAKQKGLGEAVNSFADRGKGNSDRQNTSTDARQCRLGIYAGIVRLMNDRIRKKGGYSQKDG